MPVTHKTLNISKAGILAKEWDGATDTNTDGSLTYAGDSIKSFEITSSNVVYYSNGLPSVTIDVDGTTLS